MVNINRYIIYQTFYFEKQRTIITTPQNRKEKLISTVDLNISENFIKTYEHV